MSITPYINYTVSDLSNVVQPYVNSTTEFGYFGDVGTKTLWNSMPTYLLTNNGVAAIDASGLRILNAGVYKLSLSIDISAGIIGTGNQQMFFNFGTRYLSDVIRNEITGSFGESVTSGMFSYYNVSTFPKIISWITSASSNTNTLVNETWSDNNSNNQLVYVYNFNCTAASNAVRVGCVSTELTFVTNQPTTIYFNAINSDGTLMYPLTMRYSYFTLQLMTLMRNFINRPIASYTWNTATVFTNTTTFYPTVESTGNGRYLYIPYYYLSGTGRSSKIKRFDFSGNLVSADIVSFPDVSLPVAAVNTAFYSCAASSNDGNIVYFATSGVSTVSAPNTTTGIYRTQNGNETNVSSITNTKLFNSSVNIISIDTSSDGSAMQAVGNTGGTTSGGTLISYIPNVAYSNAINTQTLPAVNFRGIALNSDGINGYVTSDKTELKNPATDISGNIYRLVAKGVAPGKTISIEDIFSSDSPETFKRTMWVAIKTSSDGRIVFAGSRDSASEKNQGLWRSIDFGNNWTELDVGRIATNGTKPNWVSITGSSDGQRLLAAELNGYIYSSINFGDTWSITNPLPDKKNIAPWTAVSSSSDGAQLGAVFSSGTNPTKFGFYYGSYS